MAFDALNGMIFLTILLLTFALFLLITGAFTAYFGSGKSRKIGAGLLVGGLVVGILWAFAVGPGNWVTIMVNGAEEHLVDVIVESVVVIIAAVIGAAAAIGLFLLAIMKS